MRAACYRCAAIGAEQHGAARRRGTTSARARAPILLQPITATGCMAAMSESSERQTIDRDFGREQISEPR